MKKMLQTRVFFQCSYAFPHNNTIQEVWWRLPAEKNIIIKKSTDKFMQKNANYVIIYSSKAINS